MQDKFIATFREEATDLLERLENSVLKLEERPNDREILDECFRVVHTIKGSSAMFGYATLSLFSHNVETVIQRCRDGGISISGKLTDLGLKTGDLLKKLLASDEPPPQELIDEGTRLLERYTRLFPGGIPLSISTSGSTSSSLQPGEGIRIAEGQGRAQTASPVRQQNGAVPGKRNNYHIIFRPERGIFRTGTRVLKLLDELSMLGNALVFPHTDDIPPLEEIDSESCYCSWNILLSTDRSESDIRDVFAFVLDRAELSIEELTEDPLGQGRTKRLGDILLDRGAVSPENLKRALGEQKRLGQVLVDGNYVSESEIESALAEQELLKRVREGGDGGQNTIRVSGEKLDMLIELASELSALQSRFSLAVRSSQNPRLESLSEESERIISQFQDEALAMRTLPVGDIFGRYRRLVRDLSLELGKEADFSIEGGEIELDRSIAERLNGPLIHAIRNSLDHGIEQPSQREKAGKPRRGMVKLSAALSGADVLITVSDDGRGLDREAILGKAIELGLISGAEQPTDSELYSFVFRPGFSTKCSLSTLSGRGYGMDVVQREIEDLGGSVKLDSKPGRGLSVIMSIPLNFSVVQGLLVRVAEEYFILPFEYVEGRLELQATQNDRFEFHGEEAVLLSLRVLFDIEGRDPEMAEIAVLRQNGRIFGLEVDEILGEKRLLIRPLGRVFRNADGITGAADLGQGSLALLLDMNRLSALAAKN